MSLDQPISVLVTITLIEMMVLIGLRVTFSEFIPTAKNWRLVARAAVSNYLLVPGVAVLLLYLLSYPDRGGQLRSRRPARAVRSAFCGNCAGGCAGGGRLDGGPGGSWRSFRRRCCTFYCRGVADGEAPRIELIGVIRALLVTQLLPLVLGLAVRHWNSRLAERLLGPFDLASKVLNLSVAGLILNTQFQMLTQIRTRGFFGMLILLFGSLVIGWLAGPGKASRRTMTLTTSRNVGMGLVIVTGNFRRNTRGHCRIGLWHRRGAWIAAGGAVGRSPDAMIDLPSRARKD